MNAASGWNMHSVVEMVPMASSKSRLATALDLVDEYAFETLGSPIMALSTLKYIMTSPKVELSHLRELGDQVKFVTIPFAYLDPASYVDESLEMKQAIQRFVDVLSPSFHPYVLCPIEHYSLARHIEAREDLPVMVPEQYAQVFQMLEMCLPVFRGFKKDISELRQKLEMNIRAQQERERVRMRDPMLVAIPKNAALDGKGQALIGPAWGPDLEDILLASFQLTAKPQQRKFIEDSVQKLLGGNEDAGPAALAGPYSLPRLMVNDQILREVASKEPIGVEDTLRRFLEESVMPTDGAQHRRIARLAVSYIRLRDQRR
ncbi:MAG: hypothetical protein ABIP96_00710 [Patescibacteria group bacterium]